MPSPYQRLNDPDWLRGEYLGRGRTAASIAAEVGCPHGAVDRALQRHGIRRGPKRASAEVPTEWLHEQHVELSRPLSDLAAELRLPIAAVRRALVEAGISERA